MIAKTNFTLGPIEKFIFFEFQNFDGPLAPLNGQFIEKVNHYTRTKQMNLSMGPIVIFFFGSLRLNFQLKKGVNFFRKVGHKGGWGPRA